MTPRWQTWARLLMWEALDGGAGSAPYPEGTVPGDLLAIHAAQERGEIDPELDPHVLTLAFIAITFWPTMFPQSTKRLTEGMPKDEPSVHHVGQLHPGGRGGGLPDSRTTGSSSVPRIRQSSPGSRIFSALLP